MTNKLRILWQTLPCYFLNKQKWVVGITLSLLCLLSVTVVVLSGEKLRYYDETEYYEIARNFIKNKFYSLDGIHPTAYKPPVYPFILTLLYYISGNIIILKLINCVALVLSALIVYHILSDFNQQLGRLISGILIIGYPILVYTTSTLYPQSVGASFFLLSILLLFRGKHSCAMLIVSSVLFGVLILTIPTFLAILPVFVIWILFNYPRKRRWGSLFIFSVCSLMIVSVWSFRNYRTFNTFIPVSTNTGINLLFGNSEFTRVNAGGNTDISTYKDEVSKQGMNEIEQDRFYRSAAIQWISENKMKALKLYFLKLLNYFNYRNEVSLSSEKSHLRDKIMFLTYYSLLLCAFIRLLFIQYIKLEKWEILLYILYVWFGCFSAIFFTRIRFRLPFDYLLIILASSFISKIFLYHSRKLNNNSIE